MSIIANAFVISSRKSGNALHEVVLAFLLICDTLRDAKSGFFFFLSWEVVWMGSDKNGLALHYGNALGTDIPRPAVLSLAVWRKRKWFLN